MARERDILKSEKKLLEERKKTSLALRPGQSLSHADLDIKPSSSKGTKHTLMARGAKLKKQLVSQGSASGVLAMATVPISGTTGSAKGRMKAGTPKSALPNNGVVLGTEKTIHQKPVLSRKKK